MEQYENQVETGLQGEFDEELYRKKESKSGVLPVISLIISVVTMILTIVILCLVIVGSRTPVFMGTERIEGMPSGGMQPNRLEGVPLE